MKKTKFAAETGSSEVASPRVSKRARDARAEGSTPPKAARSAMSEESTAVTRVAPLPHMAMPRIGQAGSARSAKPRKGEVPAIGAEVRQTHLAFKTSLHEKLRARNVTSAQWAFFRILWNEDGINQKDLAQRVGVRSATAVPAISILARNGYVRRVRSSRDRRNVYVYLTEAGRQLAFDLIPFATANNKRALKGIAPTDVKRLMEMLWTIQQNLAY